MCHKVPVVEVGDHESDIIFVPIEDIDEFLGANADEYDYGLGEMAELGAIKASVKGKVSVKTPPKPAAKKPAPKPAAKKPAPKPAPKVPAKPAAKPAPKPVAKKPAPKAAAKPAAKVSVATSAKMALGKAAKPAIPKTIFASVATKSTTVKKPAAKPAIPKNIFASVATKSTTVKKPAPKPAPKPAAKKPTTIAKASGLISAGMKAMVTSKAKLPIAPKPVVAKISAAPMLKIVAKPLIPASTVVSKVASLAPAIKALPTASQKLLGAAATSTLAAKKLVPAPTPPKPAVAAPKPGAAPIPRQPTKTVVPAAKLPASITQAPKPVAALMGRLSEVGGPERCACVVARKKPEKASLGVSIPSLRAKFIDLKIPSTTPVAPKTEAEFQAQVLLELRKIAANTQSPTLKAKLQKLQAVAHA